MGNEAIQDTQIVETPKIGRRKRKKPYSSMTITTGDIGLNIDRFNAAFGSTEGSEVGVGGGGPLSEAKRYVRRYYIRPQNIFCSNKAEVVKALIDIGNSDCSVYTLNNLGDEKDVTKLMNSDIIYYYDDGILYDKNHVKVMDYDLSIKREEDRKKFSDVNKASDKEFKAAYADRMTDVTELEEGIGDIPNDLPFSIKTLKAILDSETDEIFIGINNQHADMGHVQTEHYSGTKWYVSADTGKFSLRGIRTGDSGAEEEACDTNYNSITDLYHAIAELDELDDVPDFEVTLDGCFNLEFESYNVFGEKLTESRKYDYCCICGEPLEGYGNNPEPYMSADEGDCCDGCNLKFVIPARLNYYKEA